MSSEPLNHRKRKPTVVVSNDDDNDGQSPKESKSRRVSTDTLAFNVASLPTIAAVTTERTSTANAVSAVNAEQEEAMESIGKLVQDLFHADAAVVRTALDALDLNLADDKKKSDKIQAVGGCLAIVQLVKDFLKKATEKIPACDQVTQLNELAELKTLEVSLNLITRLTYNHAGSKVGISSIGGVEAIVKVMKKFPNCQKFQWSACVVIYNLTCCNIGKKKAL
jgi:hypothetical protein